MPIILAIIEDEKILSYLTTRGLLKQYVKMKYAILSGDTKRASLKERQPPNSGIWQFRINHQFRAFCFFSDLHTLVVARIDNHQ